MPQRNLAVEMLRKLLAGEIKARGRKNIVQARSFAELLEQAIRKYQNRAVETAQVIEELIALAKELREADRRGEKLGLTDDEVAFYDALEVNDSAVAVLGDATLRLIAQELVEAVRGSITIDCLPGNVRPDAGDHQAHPRKYGYPLDKQVCARARLGTGGVLPGLGGRCVTAGEAAAALRDSTDNYRNPHPRVKLS